MDLADRCIHADFLLISLALLHYCPDNQERNRFVEMDGAFHPASHCLRRLFVYDGYGGVPDVLNATLLFLFSLLGQSAFPPPR